MLSLIIFGLSTACCIGGVIFIISGVRERIKDGEAVPISSISEITKLSDLSAPSTQAIQSVDKPVGQPGELLSENDLSTVKCRQEEGLTEAEKLNIIKEEIRKASKKQEDEFNEKIKLLNQENLSLKDALEREVGNKQKADLSEIVQKELNEKSEDLIRTKESLTSLSEEYYKLKSAAEELKFKNSKLQFDMEDLRKSNQAGVGKGEGAEQDEQRIKIIKDEIQKAVKKHEDELREQLENLKIKNHELEESLKLAANKDADVASAEMYRNKLVEKNKTLEMVNDTLSSISEENHLLKASAEDLKFENNKLKNELEKANEKALHDQASIFDKESIEKQKQEIQIIKDEVKKAAQKHEHELHEKINKLALEKDQASEKLRDMNLKFNELSKSFEFGKDKYSGVNEKLKQEIEGLIKQKEKLLEENLKKGKLEQELIDIRYKEDGYMEKIKGMSQEIEKLKAEVLKNQGAKQTQQESDLKIELQDARLSLKRAEDERMNLENKVSEIKLEYTQKLNKANESILILKKNLQNAGVAENKIDRVGDAKDGSMFPIVGLKNENERLLTDKVALEEKFNKLKEMNNRLAEKERTLHYELTKYRAQNLGLEKICEDFQRKIEKMNV